MESVFTGKKPQTGGDSQRKQLLGWRGLYFHPYFQLFILGLVCFMSSGMLNISGSLAGNVQITFQTLENGTLANIITNSIVAFFAGPIVNLLGVRLSLFGGGLGYSLYIVSFWAVGKHPSVHNFIAAAIGILGVCAGIFWTTQGSVMLAYPTENRKGLVIGIFHSVFYLGSLVGAAITLQTALGGRLHIANNGTYAGFFILTLFGALLALLMVNPARVVRTDGTKVNIPRQLSWKREFYNIYGAIRTDPMVLFLFPMFLVSGYFNEWQQSNYNQFLFNARTRSLNSLLFVLAQMIGSVFLGYGVLDRLQFSRRTRAFAGWIILLIMVFAVHIWAYFFQKSPQVFTSLMDYTNPAYPAYAWLYVFCGFMDSMWNTLIFWLLGAISNDISKLAVFVGFYKGLQIAGTAAAGRAEVNYFPSFIKILISSWVLCVVAVLAAFPTIYYRINETSDQDDQELSVFVPSHAEV